MDGEQEIKNGSPFIQDNLLPINSVRVPVQMSCLAPELIFLRKEISKKAALLLRLEFWNYFMPSILKPKRCNL